jgi:cytochrome P450
MPLDKRLTHDGRMTVPAYPLPRECPYHPSSGMAQLREPGPISRVRLYDGRETWLVTGPAEARALLADPRVSNRSDWPNYPVMDERHKHMRATREMTKEEEGGFAGALFGIDPPEHTRQRQMLIGSFTVRRVGKLRPRIQEIVDNQIDAMLAQGQPADLISLFCAPIPMMVVCLHLGIPYEERDRFEQAAKDLFDPAKADEGAVSLSGYLEDLVSRKETDPGEGLIDDLIAGYLAKGDTTRQELVAIVMAILVAGTVTTSSILALGTMALLEHADQYAALAGDPGLVSGAVEEILRYVSLVEQLARVSTADISIGGVEIKSGEGVLVSMAAANLDPTVTGHPSRFDVTAPPTNQLAFSHGIHHCMGRNLARIELDVAFSTLAQRLPKLQSVLPLDQVPTYHDADVQRVACLPVTW